MSVVIPIVQKYERALLGPPIAARSRGGFIRKLPSPSGRFNLGYRGILEARGGIEPPMKVLQTFALPLGYRATEFKRSR
jgi:hypothetical protein